MNTDKQAHKGAKLIKGHRKYDLSYTALEYLINEAIKGENEVFHAIENAYCMGVAAGARMTKKKYKRRAKK